MPAPRVWSSRHRRRTALRDEAVASDGGACANFRPAAFQAQELDLGTSHIGVRVATAFGSVG